MNHWPFILAAYGISVGGTLALLLVSWRAMRRAEARADALTRTRADARR